MLTVSISEDDYATQYKKKVREVTATAQIKGFRPGKVPAQHIERMYGLTIRVDAVNEILGNAVDAYIKDNNLAVLGNPIPHDGAAQPEIDWKNNREYTFVFELGLAPTFDAPVLANLTLNTFSIEVSDENVAQTIENLQKRFGETIVPERSEPNDDIFGELAKADGSWSTKTMVPTNKLNASAIASFAGKKIGDVVTFDLKAAFDTHQIQHLTSLSKAEAEQVSGDYTLTITNLNRQQLAEVNEEFYKKIFPSWSAETDTEETFMTMLREELAKAYASDATQYYQEALRKELLAKALLPLPEAFLRKWLLATNDKMTVAEVDKNIGYYIDDLRWTLIRDQIMTKQLNLEPTYQMVVDHVTQTNLAMFAQYGLPVDDESTQKAATEMAIKHLTEEKGKNWNRASQEAFTAIFYNNARTKITEVNTYVSLHDFEERMHMLVAH